MSVLESIQYRLLKTELEVSESGTFLAIYQSEPLKDMIIGALMKTVPFCKHILLTEEMIPRLFQDHGKGQRLVWLSSETEKQFFAIFPELYLSGTGVFDFSENSQELRRSPLIGSAELSLSAIEKFSNYLENFLPQYENLYYIPLHFTNRKGKTFLLDDLVRAFLSDAANTNLLIISGDKYAGKTLFLLRCCVESAKQFLKEPNKRRFPVMISLNKDHGNTADIETILLREIYDACGVEIPADHFRELYRKGKFVFLIDDLDEQNPGRTSREQISDTVGQIYRLACDNEAEVSSSNKVMAACASHYIYNHIKNGRPVNPEDHTVLYQEYAPKRDVEAVCVNPKDLDEEQMKTYLLKVTQDGISVRNILSILYDRQISEEISDPSLLRQMVIRTAPMLRDKKEITTADIYGAYADIWISREDWRSRLNAEGKKILLSDITLTMFQKGVMTLNNSEMPALKAEYIRSEEPGGNPEDMSFCPFLNCDEKGNYAFVHPSFLCYFLAKQYFDRIRNSQERLFSADKLDKTSAYFLKTIISSEKSSLSGLDLSGLDLENTNLYRANLSGVNLNKSNLKSAELMGAILSDADLTGANLSNARLTRANFHNADMTGTDLSRARLRDAELRTARLNGANFHGADLTGAKLAGAKLTFTGLSEADLTRADMSNAVLNDADLSGAKLCQANLNKADLTAANLSDADMTDADLVEAILSEADLRGARLIMANLTWAKLSQADFSNANLNRARLREADMTESNFHQSSLNQADLRWAKIDRARFRDAKLREAHFTGASITEAVFNSADLAWANFTSAILKSSDFSNANLNMAKFREADLSYSKFVGANLTWADMTKANLYKADLSSAKLVEADLQEADLRASKLNRTDMAGANLKQAKLEGAEMNGADFDEKAS